MHHFDYRDGELHAEAVNLATVARTVGTPFYCYSTATLERHYRVFAEAFADVKAIICYAMKANSNQSVLKTFARLGAGADVVSGGELKRALAAGISPDKILFSGVGKTAQELRMALDAGILSINVESESELELLSQHCRQRGAHRAHLDARQSGRRCEDAREDRHRQVREQVRRAAGARARDLCARGEAAEHRRHRRRHAHRQPDHRPRPARRCLQGAGRFRAACCAPTATPSRTSISAAASAFPITPIEEAPPDPKAYAEVVKRAVKGLDCTLLFEPGRLLVGNAGILVTRVLYMKPGEAKNFVIVDAAMNDLVRPTLYEAHHDILTVKQAPEDAPTFVADIVGPVCESGDYMAKDRALPEPKEGDLLAIMSAGAYGAVQSGTYNTRALVPEVLVKEDRYAVVRPRVEVEDIIALDRDAPWLGEPVGRYALRHPVARLELLAELLLRNALCRSEPDLGDLAALAHAPHRLAETAVAFRAADVREVALARPAARRHWRRETALTAAASTTLSPIGTRSIARHTVVQRPVQSRTRRAGAPLRSNARRMLNRLSIQKPAQPSIALVSTEIVTSGSTSVAVRVM